jgi:hypothetical protein
MNLEVNDLDMFEDYQDKVLFFPVTRFFESARKGPRLGSHT